MHLHWLVEASWVEFWSSSAHNVNFLLWMRSEIRKLRLNFEKNSRFLFECVMPKTVGCDCDGYGLSSCVELRRQLAYSVQSSRIQTHRCCGVGENFQKKFSKKKNFNRIQTLRRRRYLSVISKYMRARAAGRTRSRYKRTVEKSKEPLKCRRTKSRSDTECC